jgi:hypothetical protein
MPRMRRAWHWWKVGAELNRMRATMLLAEVHSLLGFGPSALAYAEEMREYFLRVGAPDWETAFVHVVHAHAASAAREAVKHRASYESAVAALGNISNEEEQRIVASTFSHVPTMKPSPNIPSSRPPPASFDGFRLPLMSNVRWRHSASPTAQLQRDSP